MRYNQSESHGDLTRLETAEELGIGLTKVDRLIASGVLESYKLGQDKRSARRIKWESVQRLRNGETLA